MTSISKIVSTLIKDGIRELKILAYGGYDVRLVGECLPYGYDTNPIAKAKAFLTKVLGNGNDVVIGYRNKQAKAEPGESRLYATDEDGVVKFNIWLRADGSILIGDSDNPAAYTKHFVQYEAFNTVLQNYLTTLNTNIASGISGAGGAYTTPPAPNFSTAKTDNVKTK